MSGEKQQRDGREVWMHHGDPAGELRALRTGVVLADLGYLGLTELSGPGAWDLADRVFPRDLFLRDGKALQTLLLDPEGTVVADVLVVNDDDRLLVISDGMTPEAFRARLKEEVAAGEEVELRAVDDDHALVEVTGPYAWELMARLDGPGILGLPYLDLAHLEDGLRCIRAGRTGEYAYDILVPRAALSGLVERLEDCGAELGLRRCGLDVLDHAALENWFFNPHAEGRHGLNPLELQLQWRVSRMKSFVGSDALAAAREKRIERRVTAIRGPRGLASGSPVTLEGAQVGEVLVARDSPIGEDAIGLALLGIDVAEVGLDVLTAPLGALTTVSPPFVVNHSLVVKPQQHAFATRSELVHPPGSWT